MATGTQIEVVMPQMGVSVSEGTITKWLKQPGEAIAQDEPLLEISTDKVDTEVPSPGEGVVAEILVAEGETVDVGTLLAVIAPAGSAVAEPAAARCRRSRCRRAGRARRRARARARCDARARCGCGRACGAAGCVRERPHLRLARGGADRGRAGRRSERRPRHGDGWPRDEEGHPGLHRVRCRPAGGRAAPAAAAPPAAAPAPRQLPRPPPPSRQPRSPPPAPAAAVAPAAAPLQTGEVSEPMTAMRRGVMEHMRRSLDTSAHVTSGIEVDMSKIVAARERLKKEYQSSYGVNPTYLAFIAHATVETLRDYPWVNAEIRGESIVTRPWVNLGIAVALEDGKGLIVPVIKNAQDLNLLGMARAIADIATRARTKKLLPDDVQGGTFTITNPGGFGTFHGTPIISQPQVGILGTYALVKRPVGRPGRARPGRDRDPAADEPHPHLRPPARRRRLQRRLPPRPARAARGLGAGGLDQRPRAPGARQARPRIRGGRSSTLRS